MDDTLTRRHYLGLSAALAAGLALGSRAMSETTPVSQPPSGIVPGKIPVAIVIDDYTNLMDTACVWEPFLAAGLPAKPPFKPEQQLFSVFIVGERKAPYQTSGNMPGPNGLIFTPHYSFADAPQPKIVVYPSQVLGNESKAAWVRKVEPAAEVMLAVCLGAAFYASLGLLDGKKAASHHAFIDDFAEQYPKVNWQRGRRFVDEGKYVTSGGYTSSLDASLHVISRYQGADVARRTAEWLEYDGDGWLTGVRAST